MGDQSAKQAGPLGEPVDISPVNAAKDDAAALIVRLQKAPAACGTSKGVAPEWLQDRLDLFVIAVCTYAVRGLPICFAGIKFIHERALFGAGERIACGLGLKTIDAMLFLFQLQKRALHRYLLRLKSDQTIEELCDQVLRRSGIDIRLIDQGFDVLCSVRRTLGEAYKAGARSKDGGHEL